MIKRVWVQISSLVFFNIPFLAAYLKYVPAPVLNCYACPLAATACPLGTLQFFIYTGQIPYYAFAIILIYGLSLGSTFCGYLCPFGFFQDLMFKTSKKEFSLPKWTGYLKYGVLLVFVIILPMIYFSPVFCKWCPAGTLEATFPILGTELIKKWSGALTLGMSPLLEMVGILLYFKLLIFFIIFTLFIFYKRPFCRVCPLGAIFSIFNKISLWNNKPRNISGCSSCNVCIQKCPTGIDPEKEYLSVNCIQCNECKTTQCKKWQKPSIS